MKLYEQHPRLFTRGQLKLSHLTELEYLSADRQTHVFALASPNDEIEAAMGSRYHRRLIADGRVDAHIWDIVIEILAVWNRGDTVVIHCHAGRNRAAFVAGLTLRQITGWSGPQVIEHVQRVRPNALANPHFLAYLESLT